MMTNQWLNLHLGFALDVNCELQGALQRGEQIVRGSLCAFGVWTWDPWLPFPERYRGRR